MSSSTWSRTMSTFSRASSRTSISTYDEDPDKFSHQESDGDASLAQIVDELSRRKSSSFVPLFGNFQWGNRQPDIHLPVQEPEPAYQEALADVEEDPDFVEVEVKPKAGPILRRASLLGNVFTSNDVDVDPDLEFEPSASESEVKQGIAAAQLERSHRKKIYSRNVAVASFAIANATCIALSLGLLSFWYALVPLVVAAPLLRSATVVHLFGVSTYKKIAASPRKQVTPSDQVMDYATVLAFTNQSLDEMENSLDAVANQQGVDMHNNMLFLSCSDEVLSGSRRKSTTRILLENVLTNIVDEAKFQIPREDDEYEFTTMWCRRGIYKGLPYVLMVKEGAPGKTETLDLARRLLYAYNRRKEDVAHTVPSAFFAWYREWAELHDFASFDFLVSVSSDTSIDENCISELYRQHIEDPECMGTSSLVEVGSQSHRWALGNLFQKAQYMCDQLLKQSHQSLVTRHTVAAPDACQMLKICEETCGPQIFKDIKDHRPSPMDHIIKQVRSLATENDMLYAAPGTTTRQTVRAVAYTRPSTTMSNFFGDAKRFSLSSLATNLSIASNSHMHWFERLSSATELLSWCLPVFSLVLIANFLRAAALQQNIPVLIVLSVVVALPWLYSVAAAMWVARSRDERLRLLVGFFLLILLSPFVAVVAVASTIMNLHRLSRDKQKSKLASEPTVCFSYV